MERNHAHLDLQISDQEDSVEAKQIHDELRREIEAGVGSSERRAVIISARDQAGEIQGGLRGFSHWRWLYISHLWVAANARSQGLGAQLLSSAREQAKHRNCLGIYVDTFDERARDFYRRNGFEEFGKIGDFPPGKSRHYLSQRF